MTAGEQRNVNAYKATYQARNPPANHKKNKIGALTFAKVLCPSFFGLLTFGVRGARDSAPEKATSYSASLSTPWLAAFAPTKLFRFTQKMMAPKGNDADMTHGACGLAATASAPNRLKLKS
jgi:hypothetical protein